MISVSLIDLMGDDLSVVNSARVSFDKHKEEFDESDTKLMQYLAKHNHWTPFSHCTATFMITAPVFCARQLFKHKVGISENEISRRYVDDEPGIFHPGEWRTKAENKKQGSGDPHTDQESINQAYLDAVSITLAAYDHMIEEGVAPEQARMVLPQSMMTSWYWTGSLAAFARVCKQRMHDDSQAETRYVAEMISELLAPHFPVAWEVLCGHLIPQGEPIH